MFLCVFIHVLQHIHFRQNTHENGIFITKGVLYFTMKVARDKKVNLLVRHLPCISKVQNSCGLAPNVQACEAGTNVTLRPQFCTIASFFSAGTLQKNCRMENFPLTSKVYNMVHPRNDNSGQLTKILSWSAIFSCLDPIFPLFAKDSHLGKMVSCHEKIYILL